MLTSYLVPKSMRQTLHTVVRCEGTFVSGLVKDIYNSGGQQCLRGDRGRTHFPNQMYKRYTTTRRKVSLPNVNKYLRTTLQYSSMYNKI